MKTASFDNATRQTALELVSTLAEQSAKMLRAQQDTLKQHFFPAIFIMLTEVEDNMADWLAEEEADVHGKEGISDVASEALERLADQLGEKTMVACSSHLIMEGCAKADSWQYRQAGFVFLGMISEACEKHF